MHRIDWLQGVKGGYNVLHESMALLAACRGEGVCEWFGFLVLYLAILSLLFFLETCRCGYRLAFSLSSSFSRLVFLLFLLFSSLWMRGGFFGCCCCYCGFVLCVGFGLVGRLAGSRSRWLACVVVCRFGAGDGDGDVVQLVLYMCVLEGLGFLFEGGSGKWEVGSGEGERGK